MLWFLWFIPCAIANRIRGGWLANCIKEVIPFWATTPARIFVALVISFPVFFTHEWKQWIVFLVLLFTGFTFRWSPWNIMENPIKDTLMLTIRGLILTFPAGFFIGFYKFALSGLLMGVIYLISYHLPLHYRQRDGYVWDGSDWGELFFGANLGLFIGLSAFLRNI